ncbi:sensor histidine kinase [Roseiarcus fermentans]|uniref:sensor histidine kinase n=1 Tax=Roseiarcus fermentans TaxID=1473586 RepID=UPI001472C784|nr:ATP-binding protein [Roseiarcus fermentans]
MFRVRLLRTASFRLAALYLALFTASALALGAFVYLSVRREILTDFDERIVEETDALKSDFADGGRERLAAIIEARGKGGAGFSYGLLSREGGLIAGDLRVPSAGVAGWTDAQEADSEEPAESTAEVIRTLVTPLADGSSLLVGDERRRPDEILAGVLTAFAWAVAATLALGTIGGLWLSAHFLERIDSMRQTARRLMDGDWTRRIPLSRTDDDLTALARTFNRLFDRIEKLLQANRQVSADIAHDLRKPLAGVLRRLEAARDDPSAAASREAIGAAIGDVEGVLDTFNALLRIGQVEAGARRAAFRPLDLADVAREVAETFAPAAEDEGKALVQRLDVPLPIAGDRELLVQMIANLLDNALRHTAAGVRIEVGGEKTAGGIALTVSDNGAGVAPGDRAAIFQRFYRGGESRRSPGTGLGLALVAAIADLHGLDCRASDNRPGLRVTLATAAETE